MAHDADRTDGRFHILVRPRSGRTTWVVRAWFSGSRSAASETHRTEAAAVAAAGALWAAYQRGDVEGTETIPDTLGALVEAFVARTDISPRTQRSYAQALLSLTRAVGETRLLAHLHPRDVRGWLAGLTCGDVSRQTYLRTARACLRWGRARGFYAHDPTDGVSVSAKAEMRPWLRPGDWPAFLAACPPSLRIRAGFVLETGLRLGELTSARWPWVHSVIGRPAIRIAEDPASGFVPKWGRARAVPLSTTAQRYLDEAREEWGDSGYIFGPHKLSAGGNLSRRVHEACGKAGVTQTDFHGLRRSCGAAWLELGASLHEVSRLLGHSTVTTTERWYAGVADAHLAAVIGRVEEARASAAAVKTIGPRARGRER